MNGSRRLVDAAERERIRSDLDSCLCVEAAAGTGKTTLLLDRVWALLQSGRASPAQIAAITFTELAAAELRSRLREKAMAVSAALAEELEAAQISTIHSLALLILRERPIEAGLPPGFQVVDPAAGEELLEELWQAWLASQLTAGQGRATLRMALAAGLRLEDLRRAAVALYQQRDLVLQASAPESPAGPAAADSLEQLIREMREWWGPGAPVAWESVAAGDPLAQAAGQLRGLLDELERVFPLSGSGFGPEPEPQPEQEPDLELELARLWQRVRAVTEGASFLRRAGQMGRQQNWPSRQALQQVRDTLAGWWDQLQGLERQLRQEMAGRVLHWLCGWVAWAQAEKKRRGLVDFLDQLLWCRDLLRDDLEVRRHYQARWRYLLVDEFQDTDPLQAEIVFYLAEAEPRARAWDQVKLGPGRLFLVGDPKQSIYRFRRADMEMYRRAAAVLEQQGGRLFIRQNFRTLPPITAWVNQIFGRLMGPPGGGPDAGPAHAGAEQGQVPAEGGGQSADAHQAPYVPLEPYRESPVGAEGGAEEVLAPGVYCLHTGADEQAGVGVLRQQEARALAHALAALLGGGRLRVWDAGEGGWRAARPGDVAILVPAFTELEVYERELRSTGLPVRVVGGRQFFERDEVREVVAALWAVDNPFEPMAVLAALRSAFFGVSDASLARWAAAGGQLAALEPFPPAAVEAAPEVACALRELLRWHRELAALPPRQAVRRLLDESGYRAFLALQPGAEQALANVAKVEAYAAMPQGPWSSLHGFVRWLRRRGPWPAAAAAEEEDALPADWEAADAVRVMTVHRAKGLEFPVVFVANLFDMRGAWPPVVADRHSGRLEMRVGSEPVRLATAGYEECVQEEQRRERAEQVRLYYVAMTRARDYLVVCASSRRHGFWKEVQAAFPEGVPYPPPLVVLSPGQEHRGQAQVPEPPEQRPGDWERWEQSWQAERRSLLERASSHPVVGPAREDGPGPGYERDADAAQAAEAGEDPDEDRARWDGTRVGQAFHLLMERAGLLRLSVDGRWLARQLRSWQKRLGLEEEEFQAVWRWACQACHPDSTLRQWACGCQEWATEVPFVLREGDRMWEGRVDVAVRRGDGEVWLVDYKTEDLPAAVLAARYGTQMRRYGQAFVLAGARRVRLWLYAAREGRLVEVPQEG